MLTPKPQNVCGPLEWLLVIASDLEHLSALMCCGAWATCPALPFRGAGNYEK